MKNTKHTPGPWLSSNVSTTINGEIHDSDGDLIMNLQVCRSLDENVANAALIAAAPELLEALEFLKKWHEAKGKGTLRGVESIIEAYVLPAIAKAKGEL